MIEKLIQPDKLKHLIGGIYLYLFFQLFLSVEIAAVIAVVFGVLKELVWDLWMGKGTPEVLDAVMVAVGAVSILITDLL